MKLCDRIPDFYINVSGSDLYISTIGLIWNLYSPVLRERTLGSTADRTAQPYKIHQLTERIKDRGKRQMKNTEQAKTMHAVHPAV